MERVEAFLAGFLIVGLVGWFAAQIVQNWVILRGAIRRIFSLPNPVLRPIPGSRNRSIGTDPEQPPVEVLSQGCSIVFERLVTLAILLGVIIFLLWFGINRDTLQIATIPEFFFGGFVFAPLLRILLALIYGNWAEIQNLYNRMINSPTPSLNRAASPNNHFVGARPTVSAFEAIVGGWSAILGRLILQLFLLIALFLLLQFFYLYLTN